MDLAQAVEDFRLAEEELFAPADRVDDFEPVVLHFASSATRREGWSILDAAGLVAATAIADYEVAAVSGMTLAEQLRAFDFELPGLDRTRSRRGLASLSRVGALVD
jgi:hypothetical protein